MMKTAFLLASLNAVLAGCMTMSGTYEVSAVDAGGLPLTNNRRITAEGSRIYPVRNALCATYPKATVLITDATTGKELKGESPYQCR